MKTQIILLIVFLVFVISSMGLFSHAFAQSMNMSMSDQNMGSMAMSQMTYDVMAADKNYQVSITSNGKLPASVHFNQDMKSVIFDVSGLTSTNLIHYEVRIPNELLNGNFTVMLGNSQVKSVPESNDTFTTFHINVPASFVKSNNIGDSSTLTIMGTKAIPEFPIGTTLAMLTSMILAITLIKTKTRLRLQTV